MRTRTMTALVRLQPRGWPSCVKLHEEVETETLKHQQTEIEIPQDTPWDDVPQEDNQTGH